MQNIVPVLICTAVSAALTALSTFLPVPVVRRVVGWLGFIWLGAALPVLYFLNVSWPFVLVFYLLAALVNMIIARKGGGNGGDGK